MVAEALPYAWLLSATFDPDDLPAPDQTWQLSVIDDYFDESAAGRGTPARREAQDGPLLAGRATFTL